MKRAAVEIDGQGRTWSLRREWSRAFTIMLLLLLAASVASIVGVSNVVGDVRGRVAQLNLESVTIAALRLDLTNHEQLAHKLLSNASVDRAAFVQQQQSISREFDAAATVFPSSNGLRAILVAAHQSWQNGLQAYGLWGDQVQALHGNHSADNPALGAASDANRALLDSLEAPSHRAMNQDLAHNAILEQVLIASLIGLFGFAFAVTVYFRRRMSRDLLRPVATMHEGVMMLQAGDFGHRIVPPPGATSWGSWPKHSMGWLAPSTRVTWR